ncbi:hypothetical protein T440DRAFT_212253 [Plenodomus tracheiphilus IPT5]|uniref:Uncharacterized protein n=1 Tax=Plenodomus tracheiphilus IPT5 TaxID=1408161 RepID=A0A6A7AWX5_9PLEO|nr:hypothetical protein T440DRAFT_212253 [Plenodomus tracheiphilus IPT5]
MPPKKSTTPGTNNGDATASDGNTKFTWEGPNDYKLLLLTQGRYVKPEEYEKLATAFTGDTSTGSIRNRISKLRVLQRNLYEELGWELPEGGAGHSSKKTATSTATTTAATATPKKTPSKKRAGSTTADADDGGDVEATPSKRQRVKKGGKKKEVEVEEDGGRDGGEDGNRVKKEVDGDDEDED